MREGDIEFDLYQTAVRHFRPPVKITPIKGEIDSFHSPSSADSYLVCDDIEQQLALLKVFEADDVKEELEIQEMAEGLKFMSQLGLVSSEAATPLEFIQAKTEAPSKQYVVLFNIPEGRTLLTHIRYLSKQPEFSLERKQAFEILRDGYRKLGEALAELHTKKFSPVCAISQYYWEFHMNVCRSLVKSLKIYEENLSFDLAEFSKKLIHLAAQAYAQPCSAGFLHGNLTPNSIAYEPFSGVLSLMNMEDAYHSIDKRKMPCGPTAYDYMWAEASLELHMTNSLASYDELNDILFDFRHIYKKAMRERYPKPHHLLFYTVLFWLAVYKQLFVRYEGLESEMSEKDLRIFKLAFSKISTLDNI